MLTGNKFSRKWVSPLGLPLFEENCESHESIRQLHRRRLCRRYCFRANMRIVCPIFAAEKEAKSGLVTVWVGERTECANFDFLQLDRPICNLRGILMSKHVRAQNLHTIRPTIHDTYGFNNTVYTACTQNAGELYSERLTVKPISYLVIQLKVGTFCFIRSAPLEKIYISFLTRSLRTKQTLSMSRFHW